MRAAFFPLVLVGVCAGALRAQEAVLEAPLPAAHHGISSHRILADVQTLCEPRFQGRLTGAPGWEAAVDWSIERFKALGLQPAPGGWKQTYPQPWTQVKSAGRLALTRSSETVRTYAYETEFFPGATSDKGEVTAEAVYVGHGITAPELGYDDYAGLDVKGKVVVLEPEGPVPVSHPDFPKWRKYTFHDPKVLNAKAHGAGAVLFNYHLSNPNCVFQKDLLAANVGKAVMKDLFEGSGRTHEETLQALRKDLKPISFATGKRITLAADTEHHPDGKGCNVAALLPGTDPALKDEVILIGAHLDHIGMQPVMMPGANDNASSCGVLFAVAEALAATPLKRSVGFLLFGSEEQGIRGSDHYVKQPLWPKAKVKVFLNLESVGRGEKISLDFGKNFPDLSKPFIQANQKGVRRELRLQENRGLARPRQDTLPFFWAGYPTLGFGTFGAKPLPWPAYHTPKDRPDTLDPEIMEDVARVIYLGLQELDGTR